MEQTCWVSQILQCGALLNLYFLICVWKLGRGNHFWNERVLILGRQNGVQTQKSVRTMVWIIFAIQCWMWWLWYCCNGFQLIRWQNSIFCFHHCFGCTFFVSTNSFSKNYVSGARNYFSWVYQHYGTFFQLNQFQKTWSEMVCGDMPCCGEWSDLQRFVLCGDGRWDDKQLIPSCGVRIILKLVGQP